ncbi:MAG: VOC family protein [Anaerolineae bacterium]|nr:VOC family protein [Anaerolineae bacterium]
MHKITPCLWFEGNAETAVAFYTSIFNHASTGSILRYGEEGPGDPGSVVTMEFMLEGQPFIALNGGPYATFTPAVSFFVSCHTRQELEPLWEQLAESGRVLMPLDTYPFSEYYGWVEDRFGISWQLNLEIRRQKITPCIMFVGEQHGKAEQALGLYTSVFEDTRISGLARYEPGDGDLEGTIKHAAFTLQGQEFIAMDSGLEHAFTITPAISFFVNCADQAEVDRLWDALTAGGEILECGWLTDRYGVTWQIIPGALMNMLQDEDPAKAGRVTKAMLQMKKIDLPTLEAAYTSTGQPA